LESSRSRRRNEALMLGETAKKWPDLEGSGRKVKQTLCSDSSIARDVTGTGNTVLEAAHRLLKPTADFKVGTRSAVRPQVRQAGSRRNQFGKTAYHQRCIPRDA